MPPSSASPDDKAIVGCVVDQCLIKQLPIAQYPDIAPPVVNIAATYPGASAKVVEETVTSIIEREMNGMPGLMYVSATSNFGMASVSVTFKQGTNPDLAAVDVQNRLKSVEVRLLVDVGPVFWCNGVPV